jgi:hypothetical protein
MDIMEHRMKYGYIEGIKSIDDYLKFEKIMEGTGMKNKVTVPTPTMSWSRYDDFKDCRAAVVFSSFGDLQMFVAWLADEKGIQFKEDTDLCQIWDRSREHGIICSRKDCYIEQHSWLDLNNNQIIPFRTCLKQKFIEAYGDKYGKGDDLVKFDMRAFDCKRLIITCNTKDDSKKFLSFLKDNGRKWSNGDEIDPENTTWSIEQNCYYCYGNGIRVNSMGRIDTSGCEIIPFENLYGISESEGLSQVITLSGEAWGNSSNPENLKRTLNKILMRIENEMRNEGEPMLFNIDINIR